ncbi:ABC transporter ATP-binding protein [Lichenihabitans sp. Uapishka_5]|uniref:ABC transporter ATP-binding protein n=1 Tax=Lichenihabitans sp. Uapishka_5 TaxID=3037302 RepID=UPI0029E8073A|nr:ABC transporter ATP-binding protein [Lichenihabitans sp. Uapishka_5]MDX7950630.1 ABC transporter ATP-binding protein [Lichenihabitans sp. Uapishka_5]
MTLFADAPRPASRPTPILAVEAVTKRFGGHAAVDQLSLSVPPGLIAGLIGPNGAGKSTLFDLLAGRQSPTQGRILYEGQSIERRPAHRRAALGIGRTFQIPRPFGALSVRDNVMLGRQHHPGERLLPNFLQPARVVEAERAARRDADELLAFVSLGHLAGSPARVLSGGQRKLLELARVMMGQPRLLLLDEPAAGVNPSLLETIMEKVAAIAARGVTVFLIEHNMDLVSRLCGHVFVMAEGRLLCEGAPAVVVRDPRVIEAYLGTGAA